SSACGSADLLAELGVAIDLDAARMSEVLRRTGISFLFAPKLHPAMGAVAGVRRELGVRTIFNVLGPLTNPAFARRQVLGVYAEHLVERITPEEIGTPMHPIESIAGGDIKANADIALRVLRGEAGARADIVAANAGAALYVAGVVPTIRDGVVLARQAIASGKAMEKLEQL